MTKAFLRWVPLIVWAVFFKILDIYHILSIHYNAFLILLVAFAALLVLIYKFVLKEPQD